MVVVFQIMIPCSLLCGYQYFGGTYALYLLGMSLLPQNSKQRIHEKNWYSHNGLHAFIIQMTSL
jgi:hypothetical protein